MAEVSLLSVTPFQKSNLLLRERKWEQALNEYSALWVNSPYLREMIVWNIAYLLRKAPADTVSSENRRAAIKLLEKINSDSVLRVVGQQKSIKQNDPGKILDEYIKQRIAKKTLRKIPDERTVLKLASEMVPEIGHEAACLYAERYLPDRLRYTLNILKANAAISRNDEAGWLDCVNQYLQTFRLEPLYFREGNSLLSRLSTRTLPAVEHGPVVTVIMPAWNAQDTVEFAARSILNQTWQPLELIIVDDASSDSTWSFLKQLVVEDSRVKILRNKVNVGPYVSKNIALMIASGDYVTGHDADDWAHPERIQNHMAEIIGSDVELSASLGYMLRITPEKEITKFGDADTNFCLDGAVRLASISCMFRTSELRERLGFWDSVRFGADSEMIGRAMAFYGGQFAQLKQIGMICLDLETSLTNDPIHGIRANNGKLAESRKSYRKGWEIWHKQNLPQSNPYLAFPQKDRRYQAMAAMIVPYEHQLLNMQNLSF